jgi:hypothetical protein
VVLLTVISRLAKATSTAALPAPPFPPPPPPPAVRPFPEGPANAPSPAIDRNTPFIKDEFNEPSGVMRVRDAGLYAGGGGDCSR